MHDITLLYNLFSFKRRKFFNTSRTWTEITSCYILFLSIVGWFLPVARCVGNNRVPLRPARLDADWFAILPPNHVGAFLRHVAVDSLYLTCDLHVSGTCTLAGSR